MSSPPPPAGPLEKLINERASEQISARMDLPEHASVPEAIQSLVDIAVKDVAENALAVAVCREVAEAADYVVRRSSSTGLDAVMTSSDVELLQRAVRLAATRNALHAAGFSREEAMRIVVADVSAGASFTSV